MQERAFYSLTKAHLYFFSVGGRFDREPRLYLLTATMLDLHVQIAPLSYLEPTGWFSAALPGKN
jgi:hypothetical protein